MSSKVVLCTILPSIKSYQHNLVTTASNRISQVTRHLRNPIVRSHTMMSTPKTMKGVLIEKTGGVEVLDYKTDLPVPTPKAGEILVKNDFIGINYIDTYAPRLHHL